MLKETTAQTADQDNAYDEELHDALIAISVISKRLAQKITENQQPRKGENEE